MKKQYSVVLPFLITLSATIYAMERTSSEYQEEIKGFDLGLVTVPIQEVALYATSAATFAQAHANFKSLYDKFIPSENQLSKDEGEDAFDRALTLAASLDNNAYAIERLIEWLKGIGNKQAQREFIDKQIIDKIKTNSLEKASLLVGLGITDENENTSLMSAVAKGDKDLVEHLIARGAQVNAANKDGQTALMLAAMSSKEATLSIVSYLVEHRANIHAVDQFGMTALAHAALEGKQDRFKYLVKQGADLNAVDKKMTTMLMMAVIGGNIAIIKYLIDSGANIDATDASGKTARDMAKKMRREKIVAILDEPAAKLDWFFRSANCL